MNKNKLIEQHYRENYHLYVKKMRNRTRDWSLVLPEEIVQEAYTRALKYYKAYDDSIQTFDAWFHAILNNTLRSVQKEEREKGVVHTIIDDIATTDDFLPRRHDLLGHIYGMPEGRERSIVTLYYLHGFKTKDIAEYLNLGHANVRIIIMRWCRSVEQEYDILV